MSRALPRVMTPKMVADRWMCTEATVVKAIKKGKIPAFQVGSLWRIKSEDLEAYELEGGTPVDNSPCDVYVIQSGNIVKIGKAKNVQKRMADLQAANPVEIQVLATIKSDDGHALERELHKRFAEYRHRNEWFRLEGLLAAWVADGCPL